MSNTGGQPPPGTRRGRPGSGGGDRSRSSSRKSEEKLRRTDSVTSSGSVPFTQNEVSLSGAPATQEVIVNVPKQIEKEDTTPVQQVNESTLEKMTTDADENGLKNNTTSTTTKISTNYEYDNTHKGPYIVYVDALDSAGARKPINAISLDRLVAKLGITDINEILKIGYGRCKVSFKNYYAANDFVRDDRLKANGYDPKIFAHFVSKIGLVFDIPTEISMDDFQDACKSPVPILKCIRIERRDPNDEKNRIPTRRVKIIFKGLEIPYEITFQHTKVPVKYFISFAQCYRCYRFNHFAQHCKQRLERCRMCFHQHEEKDACMPLTCTNCKDNHHPTSKECPARAKAYAIRKTMTIENLSLKEARMKFSSAFSNRFSILDNEEETSFPPLKMKSNNRTQNNSKQAAQIVHALAPFSKVVRVNQNREREVRNAQINMAEWQKAVNESNTIDNTPNKNFTNPHRTSDLERFTSQINTNTFYNLKSADAEKTLNEVKSKLRYFLSQSSGDNLTAQQKLFLSNLHMSIEEKLNITEYSQINSENSFLTI